MHNIGEFLSWGAKRLFWDKRYVTLPCTMCAYLYIWQDGKTGWSAMIRGRASSFFGFFFGQDSDNFGDPRSM